MEPPDIYRQKDQRQYGATGRQLAETMIQAGRALPLHAFDQSLKPGPGVEGKQGTGSQKTHERLPQRERQFIRGLVKRQNQQGNYEVNEVGKHGYQMSCLCLTGGQ